MVVELSKVVVSEPSEDSVDSDRPDVVVKLPGNVLGEPSEETVDSD